MLNINDLKGIYIFLYTNLICVLNSQHLERNINNLPELKSLQARMELFAQIHSEKQQEVHKSILINICL